MKIVIIGGTGRIGSKLTAILNVEGHQAVPASPSSGVNTLTGEGLAEAFRNADVVVDVSNSPSFEEAAVTNFFTTSATNIATAEKATGVKHHVALSVVGAIEPSLLRAEVERAQRKRPDSLDAYDLVLRAQADVYSGMPDRSAQALVLLERALALDPRASQVRTSLGFVYWGTGQPEKAVVEWRDVLRRDATFEPAAAALAEAERRMRR